ncbi:hypothetical protein KACC15558_31600 [Brevibacterium ammoniilyticum]|uniref:Uncharacterized protein n=1 Tax=Brevibacterium ammoniilyticum TaxID=1046555 RepID=A0ABP9U4P4_9MICO
MKKLFSFNSRRPDKQFGTGLWRHNRDRFLRAVDRYYATAVAIHDAAGTDPVSDPEATAPDASAPTAPGQATGAHESAAASARETIMAGTHRLNDLASDVDDLTARLHARWPIDDQVVPGHVRAAVGDSPELLTRASAKVAEAVLAASMVRAGTAEGSALTSVAAATERFITDAADLLDRAREIIAEAERS